MRKTLTILLVALMCVPAAVTMAQKKKQKIAESTAWTLLPPLGLHEPSTIATVYLDYSRQSVPSAVSDAWACTGNLGAEGTNMIWLDREGMSDFFFRDALRAWMTTEQTQRFYNTRVPMTLLSYNAGGGKETAQDRLRGIFSGNINRRAQVGAHLDYLYSKGSYEAQADKDLQWGVNGSYMGDRLEFQGFYNHYNMLNKENGGITDDLYITDPEKVQAGVSSVNSKAIPVNLNSAHSRIVGGELLLNTRYKVGYWHEEPVNDTTVRRTYIPVTSFVWTLNYRQARHVFTDNNPTETREFFDHTFLDPNNTYDKTTYSTLTNTVGVSMLEGFHRLAKFGLSAYLTHELRRYGQLLDTIDRSGATIDPLPDVSAMIPNKVSQNLLWVGGQLTKQRGSILTYDATARIGIVGPAAGDVKLVGNIGTRFPLFGDTVSIRANVLFNNEHAPYLMNYYRSNHFIWKNDFGKQRTLRIGGVLNIPHTGSRIEAGVENIQNMIYFGPDYMPTQHNGSVQVVSVRLRQNLAWRALHWDNTVTWQKSGNESVLSLPQLAVYSNLYVIVRIATLRMQLGLDCDYYTRYYAPNYQPATMSFAHQRDFKIGNYPFMNLYANMKLGKVRFYVMMSHINQGLTGKNYFSMPHYPLNPRRFQLGLSVDFAN